jgi:PHD/YefM family antitoxin component YafN of YafNO toxin-antitoxin module
MSGLEAIQSVQFVGKKGKRFAVISADDWEALIEWLEILDDTQTVRKARADLDAAKGDRQQAGWVRWDAVSGDL